MAGRQETTGRVRRRACVRTRISFVLAGVLLVLAVAGCGAPTLPPWLVRYYPGIPAGVTTVKANATAVWMTSSEMAVVDWGSSGRPNLPTKLAVPASDHLTVTTTLYNPTSSSCTADAAPTTSIIKVPAALSHTEDVTVPILDGIESGTVSLPPRADASG